MSRLQFVSAPSDPVWLSLSCSSDCFHLCLFHPKMVAMSHYSQREVKIKKERDWKRQSFWEAKEGCLNICGGLISGQFNRISDRGFH